MATSQGRRGRFDEDVRHVSWRIEAGLHLAGMVVAAVGAWHVAVAATVEQASWTSLRSTLRPVLLGRPAVTAITVPIFAVLCVVIVTGWLWAVWALGARSARLRSRKGFADHHEVDAHLGRDHVRRSAAQTRPGLTGRQAGTVDIEQVGLPLGWTMTTPGRQVVLPLEDSLAVIGMTGAGKTSDVLAMACVNAPGALVTTSTKADILDVIVEAGERKGRVWVFDPLDRSGWPDPMYWDPVAGCDDGRQALAMGTAFLAGAGVDESVRNGGFFQESAAGVITYLLHAAALDGRAVSDVLDWAVSLDNGAELPQDIIAGSASPRAEKLWPGFLRSLATGAPETVSSTRMTLQQAIKPMALTSVLKWVTPAKDSCGFDPAAFVRSSDTLVLLSDAGANLNVSPLTTMLFQAVVDAAKDYAATCPTGRIDPPLRIVADEVANVAPMPKLPDLASDARGHGLQLLVGLQSLTQAVSRWGEEPARTLLTNCAVELVMGGLSDTATLERYSQLVGQVEVEEVQLSFQEGAGSPVSSSLQRHERPAMRPAEIRQIPRHQALMIYRGMSAVMIVTTPWWKSSRGEELSAAQERIRRRRGVTGSTVEESTREDR
jgi:type IV secretion system protein VirD4